MSFLVTLISRNWHNHF